MTTAFHGFRCHEVGTLAGRALFARQEAEYQRNEVRALRDCISKLERERKRGRGQAGGWQAVHESALALLGRAKIQPAVVVLFSVLLRGVLEKSGSLDKRAMAQWVAAEAEAKGDESSAIVRAYAKACGREARGCHDEIAQLRKQKHYQWMVEAFRPSE